MHSLIDFLYRQKHWLLFLLLEGISLFLLFSYNDYQGSIWLSSANTISGKLFEAEQYVQSFFSLRSDNRNLAEQNARLEERIYRMDQMLDSTQRTQLAQEVSTSFGLKVTPATVVGNSISHSNNFITINKGTEDGIAPNMGVISTNGVVGITYKSSRHYTLVIPILNNMSSISCKVIPGDAFGYLKWRGGDSRIAQLCDVPRYAKVNVGDSIITSGHSSFFPEGLLVGTISHFDPLSDNLSNLIDVKLSTTFVHLRHVFVIDNPDTAERQNLLDSATDVR